MSVELAAMVKAASTAMNLGRMSAPISRKVEDAVKVFVAKHESRDKVRDSLASLVLRSAKRSSRVRPFLNPNEEALLTDVYTPLRIVSKGAHLGSKSARPFLADLGTLSEYGAPVVIAGTAGQGKSTLIKYLVSQAILDERLPILVILRDLEKGEGLVAHLGRVMKLSPEEISDHLDFSRLILFLDGVDEVIAEYRGDLMREVQLLLHENPGMEMYISSRPLDELRMLEGCTKFDVCGLSIKDALDLAEKLPVDPERRANFTDQLRSGLFATHEELLSNPLLLQVGFLVASGGQMPVKKSELYDKAVDALFTRHDWQKVKFQRDFISGLKENELELVFGAFCYATLLEHRFRFQAGDAEEILKDCCTQFGMSADPALVLRDISQSLSLLIQDGLEYSFLHRQVQSFLAIRYVLDLQQPSVLVEAFESFHFVERDEIRLLCEMRPLACIQLLKSQAKKLLRECPQSSATLQAMAFWKATSICANDDDHLMINVTDRPHSRDKLLGRAQRILTCLSNLSEGPFRGEFAGYEALEPFIRNGALERGAIKEICGGLEVRPLADLSESEVERLGAHLFGGPEFFKILKPTLEDCDRLLRKETNKVKAFTRRARRR